MCWDRQNKHNYKTNILDFKIKFLPRELTTYYVFTRQIPIRFHLPNVNRPVDKHIAASRRLLLKLHTDRGDLCPWQFPTTPLRLVSTHPDDSFVPCSTVHTLLVHHIHRRSTSRRSTSSRFRGPLLYNRADIRIVTSTILHVNTWVILEIQNIETYIRF